MPPDDSSSAPGSLSLREAWATVRGDATRAGWMVALFEVAYKSLVAAALAPPAAWALSLIVRRTGHAAVGNEELLEFFLSPTGVFFGAAFVATALGSLLAESAGVIAIVAWKRSGEGKISWRTGASLAYYGLVLFRLGVALATAATALAVPFVAALAGVYLGLLSQFDVNYYLSARPPAFFAALGAAAALAAAYAGLAVWIGVRWSLAVPLALFDDLSVVAALRESWRRTRPFARRLATALVGWHAAVFVVGVLIFAAFRWLADAALDATGERLGLALPLVAALLVVQAALLLASSAASVVGHSLIVFAFYSAEDEAFALKLHEAAETAPSVYLFHRRRQLALAAIVLLGGMIWGLSLIDVDWRRVEITSHRGHGHHAPENTLAAIRQAIDAGADFVEIDVQLTRDDAIVLAHDRDLKRVADAPLRVDQSTLEELRRLDLGRGFDGRFAGERIATLDEAIELARGRIRINIELKHYGGPRVLAERVARLVERLGFDRECLVTSLDYASLLEVERVRPRLVTGLIVGAAIGDVGRLQIDVLSVRRDLVTRRLLRRARETDKRVHAWTVDSPELASRLMALGVENLITDEPARLAPLRDEWANLSDVERLLLAARYTLDLP